MANEDPDVIGELLDSAASGRILSADMGKYVEDCYHGDRPPCRCACPVDLDVTSFIGRLQRGNFGSAYTAYRDRVLFPAIVCRICEQPCLDVCVRKDIDAAIALRKLEAAAVAFAASTAPTKYRVARKDETVCIVGAGLCGLSSALKLASHGYGVTLLEQSDRVGGRLWHLLKPDDFVPELENQMQHLEYGLELATRAGDIEKLYAGYDAVLIATGADGDSFGLVDGLNADSLGTTRDGVFLAGSLLGGGPLDSIAQGIRVAQSIENYLKTGRMHVLQGIEPVPPSRLQVHTAGVTPAPAVEAELYTRDQALEEAGRCLKCDCIECLNACDMMQSYNKLPARIVSDVRVTLNNVDLLTKRVATRLLSSCNVCGLCGTVCTEHIDMGRFLLDARRIMHREGSLPPVFHDFWIRDLEFSEGDQAYLARNAPGQDSSDYLFFPGCQLGASDPAYVERSYGYLLEKLPRTGLVLGCCGVPAEWAGDEGLAGSTAARIRARWSEMGEPTVILACPTCRKMFARYLPEIATTYLYEVIAEHGLPDRGPSGEGAVSVFDPCSSRGDEALQDSVRALVAQAGYQNEELPFSGESAQCCGHGGHISVANPTLTRNIAAKRTELSPNPYVAYCTNCRDLFADQGKACRHVLDVVFGINGEERVPPSLTERRDNRTRMRASLLRTIWNEAVPDMDRRLILLISPELTEKLNAQLILESDLAETIEYIESSGNRLLDPETGHCIGHHKQGHITYWVVYEKQGDDAYRIVNAYSHRLSIEGE